MKKKHAIPPEVLNPVFRGIADLGFVREAGDYSGPVADFYDPMQSWLSEDVEFFLRELKGGRKKVLELGSGTGRIAVPLAGKGHTVYAVDSAADMQKILKSKLKGTLSRRIVPVTARIQDVDIPEKADVAIMGLNTVYGLSSEGARISAMRNISRLLRDGGVFYLDTMLPGRNLLVNRAGVYDMYSLRDKKGNTCINVSFSRYNVKTQACMLNQLNIVVDRRGRAKFYVTGSREYYPSLGELGVLLRSSGFEVVKIFSDYKGKELDPSNIRDDGQEVLIKARKTG